MWSKLLAENTIRAAALRTDCSQRNNVPDTPTSTNNNNKMLRLQVYLFFLKRGLNAWAAFTFWHCHLLAVGESWISA